MRKKYRKLMEYEHNYDWRPTKSGTPHHIGLVSPTGEQLLPNIFEDVFTEFDTQNDDLKFIPVSNGDGWAIATLGPASVLMTEFRYHHKDETLFVLKYCLWLSNYSCEPPSQPPSLC